MSAKLEFQHLATCWNLSMTNSSLVPNIPIGLSPEDLTDAFLSYRKRLEALIYRIVGVYGEAEELTQECFLRAYRARHTFQGRASISTWLTRIAFNVAYETVRRRTHVTLSTSDENIAAKVAAIPRGEPSAEQALMAEERAEKVTAAVGALAPRLRQLLELHYVNEMSISEIAKQTGMGHSAVKSLLFRARHRLRQGRLKPWVGMTKIDGVVTKSDGASSARVL
jgi:RNA polymerase sigma-70 factor (ECF subfamily)